jgi:signal transduction histidine kinase
MRSTKLVVTLTCLATAGIGTAISLAITGFWLSQRGDHWEQFNPEFLNLWIGSTVVTAVVILLPVLIITQRINRPVEQVANALAERRISSSDLAVIGSWNRDREYQLLAAEINDVMGVLRESQNRLDHYAAKVAHELRGPLTSLQLHLDHASERLDPQFVDVMTAQIRQLTEYVDTALFLAKVADHKILPVKTRQKVAKSVQEIVAPYELQAAAQQRKLSVDLPPELEAELDEKIFGLILHNLLSNAFSHGVGEIRLRSRAGNGALTLFVLNRVRTNTSTEAGTGIGLRMIENLARAHNLTFLSRRVFNCYGARLRIPTLAPLRTTSPAQINH